MNFEQNQGDHLHKKPLRGHPCPAGVNQYWFSPRYKKVPYNFSPPFGRHFHPKLTIIKHKFLRFSSPQAKFFAIFVFLLKFCCSESDLNVIFDKTHVQFSESTLTQISPRYKKLRFCTSRGTKKRYYRSMFCHCNCYNAIAKSLSGYRTRSIPQAGECVTKE